MNGNRDSQACRNDIVNRLRCQIASATNGRSDRKLPCVTLTYAQSIDGCIAQSGGKTLQLSNSHSQVLTHQLRVLHEAILVGINTVIQDDPRLNVRLVKGRNPQPVVVDGRLRFPLDANLLKSPCVRPIIFTGHDASASKARQLTDAGAKVVRITRGKDGFINLFLLMNELKRLGYASVMIEGGASIISSTLLSRIADQLVLTISPRFVGGLQALRYQGSEEYVQLPRLRNVHQQRLADDIIILADLERDGG